jgi:tRNA A37 threonylcarbamoyladenosine synthetase subunit TsaC/SUA5/YrdC
VNLIDVRTDAGRAVGVRSAAAAIERGAVVVIPTDTVYGIGANAFDSTAVAAVLAAKGRGRAMPPPVLVPSARTLDGLVNQRCHGISVTPKVRLRCGCRCIELRWSCSMLPDR